MSVPVIALLGRRDEPTDAVEEYCRYVGSALRAHHIELQMERAGWSARGWSAALHDLSARARSWAPGWVLVQYTALSWSTRGFPRRFPIALKTLRSGGVRLAVVFHDVEPFAGTRIIDRVRRSVQIRTMRRALELANTAIFTVPPDRLTWLPAAPENSVFIPVGANLPIPDSPGRTHASDEPLTVGVFSITGGEAGERETREIIAAVRHVAQQIGKLRLSVFGRQAEARDAALRDGLRGTAVELSVSGVLEDREVVERLSGCDALLFVRGGISTRRSSAIAGIACGLPVVAYSGSETAAPITEAGVVLVPPGNQQGLNSALLRVLSDSKYRAILAEASRNAYQKHFCWRAIAERFAAVLQ